MGDVEICEEVDVQLEGSCYEEKAKNLECYSSCVNVGHLEGEIWEFLRDADELC